MSCESVQQFIDSGNIYFWFCLECDRSRKLDMVRFRGKFGAGHSALAADIVPRLTCTGCKSPELGMMLQKSGSREVVPVHPKPETIEYSRAGWRQPDIYASGSCVYRLDDTGEIIEIAAWALSSRIARAAFEALSKAYPTDRFQQRRRGWIESD